MPGLTLEGVRFRVYRGSALRAAGEASRAQYRRDTDELQTSQVEATLPRGGTPGDVRITATQGLGHLRARTYQARGGLTLIQGGITARTEAARYLPGPPESIQGETPVAVEGGTWQLTGTGFTLDPASGDLSLGGPARLEAQAVPGTPARPAGRNHPAGER